MQQLMNWSFMLTWDETISSDVDAIDIEAAV
jgi:hypothetical protein